MQTLADKIAEAIGKYHKGFMQKKVLRTVEEIEASTDPLDKYVAGAEAVNELNNKLANGRVELVVNSDGTLGYKLDGADAVPFFRCEIYKFCYSLSSNNSQWASANTSFTIDKSRKYKALILTPPNGYNANTLTILKNNAQIYTRTSGTYERNFFEIREFDLKKGDVIRISTSTSASNAVLFAGVVWL